MPNSYPMTLTYTEGEEIKTIIGDYIPSGGPLVHFWVLQTPNGYFAVGLERVISIFCENIPESLVIPFKHLEMGREMQESMFERDYEMSKNTATESKGGYQ